MLPKTLINKIAALAAGAAMLFGGVSAHAQEGMAYGRSQAPAPLEGTWDVDITPYNCKTGAQLPSFSSRLTFMAGGTMVESPFNPSFQAGQRSEGLGTWERTGRQSYRAVFEAFIQFASVVTATTSPTTPRYVRGVQRVEQYIQMQDRDHWAGTAQVSFYDEAGSPLNSGCMAAVGTRQQ